MTYATIYPSIIQLFVGDGGLFQCPPKGREFVLVVFEEVMVTLLFMKKVGMGPSFWLFSFPVGKVRMGLMVDGAHPWQLCRSCDFIAQG